MKRLFGAMVMVLVASWQPFSGRAAQSVDLRVDPRTVMITANNLPAGFTRTGSKRYSGVGDPELSLVTNFQRRAGTKQAESLQVNLTSYYTPGFVGCSVDDSEMGTGPLSELHLAFPKIGGCLNGRFTPNDRYKILVRFYQGKLVVSLYYAGSLQPDRIQAVHDLLLNTARLIDRRIQLAKPIPYCTLLPEFFNNNKAFYSSYYFQVCA